MSLSINGYISQDSINLKLLEKEIKDFLNYEGEIISEKSGEAILLSNFIQNNEFVCYFVNKEGQDLVINHKPIRVMSCWNGVIVFTAEPLKDKKIH